MASSSRKIRKRKEPSKGKRGRKRKLDKLEMDDSDNGDLNFSNDDESISMSTHNRTVRFDQSVNDQSSTSKLEKYESVSVDFPKLSDYLKIMVEDNESFEDLDDEDDDKQLWLFHFPPNFDESLIKNISFSVPKYPEHGQRVGSLRIDNNTYHIMEYDCSQNNMVNLFAVNHQLKVGKPFERHFHILPDLKQKERESHRTRKIKDTANAERINALLFGDGDDEEMDKDKQKRKETVSISKRPKPTKPPKALKVTESPKKMKKNKTSTVPHPQSKKAVNGSSDVSMSNGHGNHNKKRNVNKPSVIDDDEKDPEALKAKQKKSTKKKRKRKEMESTTSDSEVLDLSESEGRAARKERKRKEKEEKHKRKEERKKEKEKKREKSKESAKLNGEIANGHAQLNGHNNHKQSGKVIEDKAKSKDEKRKKKSKKKKKGIADDLAALAAKIRKSVSPKPSKKLEEIKKIGSLLKIGKKRKSNGLKKDSSRLKMKTLLTKNQRAKAKNRFL